MKRKIKDHIARMIRAFLRINLVDRYLIVIMAILLLQSSYNMFVYKDSAEESNGIDIIVRTSAAGIFGYFISANFLKAETRTPPPNSAQQPTSHSAAPSTVEDTAPSGAIGFQADRQFVAGRSISSGEPPPKPPDNQLQINIIGAIGLYSLCALLLARNLRLERYSPLTISQLRDLISGSIGYLIGHFADPKQ